MTWWFVPREFVISSDGQCGKCKGVTLFYISRMEKDSWKDAFRYGCRFE
ncbi:unnamed protein product [Oikopleura dioica]|uniref:Uncharacterized protein n=1 Tax=Oikopleura dioica TaxID=34765 RepID=E4XV01_OIKDI|nr:unnamed protein product [Oikopleura dioica]